MFSKMNDNEYEVPSDPLGLLVGIKNAALIGAGFWVIIYLLTRIFAA